MQHPNGYDLIDSRAVAEVGGTARYFRHRQSGARILSICNKDENKVFGVNFRTPPKTSNGIAHIMEHSVL